MLIGAAITGNWCKVTIFIGCCKGAWPLGTMEWGAGPALAL